MNQPTIDPKLTIEWLNKFVVMAQWDKTLPFQVVKLLGDRSTYEGFLKRVREGNTDETDKSDKTDQVWKAVAGWPSLRELFAADVDPFAGAPLDQLQLLAEVSDMTTDPQKMVYSRNGTFIAVIEALRRSQELDTEPLLVDWLHKFLTLFETKHSVAQMLYDLAESPHWLVVMSSLRDGRDYTRDEEPAVGQTLLAWQGKLATELRALLFKPGHLSRAPTKLIRMAWNNSQLFQEARESIPVAEREKDPLEERRQVANEALLLFQQKAQIDCDEIEADLMVLATVARHFINVRKFAKLDGFVYTWPEIARVAMSNYLALEYVEDLLVNRMPRPSDRELDVREARELYDLCAANDRLIRFLRFQPRFTEIDEDEFRRYRPLAPVVITETVEAPSGGASRTAEVALPPSPPPPPAPARALQNYILEIKKLGEAPLSPDSDLFSYNASFKGIGAVFSDQNVNLSVKKMWEQIRGMIGVSSDSELQARFKELFASSPTLAEDRMLPVGFFLAGQVLNSDVRDSFPTDGNPLRFVIRSDAREMHYLPWEWLSGIFSMNVWLTNPDLSVVRQCAPPVDTSIAPLSPLRLLSITPPAPKGRRFTSGTTLTSLDLITTARPVEYKSLTQESATQQNIKEQLESFQPQVVHFEGHVVSYPEMADEKPKDFFVTASQPIAVEEFGQLLKQHGVQLLTIGRSEIKGIYENIGAQVTMKLSQQGLPAVIAPMRAIDDASATTFTAEFYDAFLQGNTLEAALYQARRRTASKGGDWSVFALFADPARLDYFQLPRDMA